ncbi:MAG: hypothetical protein ACRDRL_07995 [Sciscionella sp.]
MIVSTVIAATGLTVLAGCSNGAGGSSAATGAHQPGASVGPKSGGVNPNAPEHAPAGDIPDSTVYIPFHAPSGKWTVSVPQGWARTSSGGATEFTDKLNSVRLNATPAATAPTVASAKANTVPKISAHQRGAKITAVHTVARKSGQALLIAYTTKGAPNPVTGKAVSQSVQRYSYFHRGTLLVVTVSGPVGADNVDPWRTITDSVSWSA